MKKFYRDINKNINYLYCCGHCFRFKKITKFRKIEKNKLLEICFRCEEIHFEKKTLDKIKKFSKQINKKEKFNKSKIIYKTSKYRRIVIRKYIKNKLKTDLNFRIRNNIRSRINALMRGKNKSKSTFELLGCDVKFYLNYLSENFKKGMTHENYGEWEIDHIIPCSKFNLTDSAQQLLCFNYKNTRPLWKKDNRSKGNRMAL